MHVQHLVAKVMQAVKELKGLFLLVDVPLVLVRGLLLLRCAKRPCDLGPHVFWQVRGHERYVMYSLVGGGPVNGSRNFTCRVGDICLGLQGTWFLSRASADISGAMHRRLACHRCKDATCKS